MGSADNGIRRETTIGPAIVLALFFVSGVSALIYQFVWIRLLGHLLGGTSYAISTVLAAFMGGLALGSRWFGRRADRTERPLRLYAGLELAIAALGAIVPWLLAVGEPVYVAAARALPPGAHHLLRIAVAFAILLPPTILMGGTLPVLGRWLVRRADRLGRGLGLLYSVNTLGAMTGSLLAGFVLIPALGLHASIAIAVLGNVAVAIVAVALDRRTAPLSSARPPEPARVPGVVGPVELDSRLLVIVFAGSGAAALAYEIFWTRSLQHFLGNSTYAFSAMLTTFLLGLSLGAGIGGRLADRSAAPARLLGWIQIAIAATALATVPLIWNVLPRLGGMGAAPASASWADYLLQRFGLALGVMIVPTTLIGMVFPLVNRIGVRDLAALGGRVGFLYYANTVGAILGSLVAGFIALPLLGARAAIVAAAVVNLLLGLLVCGATPARIPWLRWAPTAIAIAILGAGWFAGLRARPLPSDTQSPGDEVLFAAEDSFAETRVYRKPNGELHMSVDGHHIGGTNPNVLRKEKVLAHLPLALTPRAPNVLAIGLGSGITLGTFALYEEIESLTCVEIAPGVVKGSACFGPEHGEVLADPRVELHVQDGVQFLLTTSRRFEVISSDSKLNPEYVGNASLLARDYYELCRERLSADGVMVQWLALHLPTPELLSIARTFLAAFPHTALFWHDPSNVILAGSLRPITLDAGRSFRLAANADVRRDLERVHLESPYAMASLWITADDDLAAAVGPGPVNTWDRPRLEFTMIRTRLLKDSAAWEDSNLRWLRDSRRTETLRLRGDRDPERLRRFMTSGGKLLEGYAAGGGVARLETGTISFREGLAANPEDRRLRTILGKLEELETERARRRRSTLADRGTR